MTQHWNIQKTMAIVTTPPESYRQPVMLQTPQGTLELGGRWPRLGAALLDFIIVGIPVIILNILGNNLAGSHMETIDSFGKATVMSVVNRNAVFFGFYLVTLVIQLAYYIYFTAQGATLGKKIAKLKVVRADGNIPGLQTAAIREGLPDIFALALAIFNIHFAEELIVLFPIIAYGFILFDGRRQSFFDKIAHTFVVRAQ